MDPSLSLEDVYTSYAMEDMKPSYLCEECCAAAEPCELIAWGRSCQRCQFHIYGTYTFRDQTYFDTFRFSTNRQGDGISSLNQTSAPPLGRNLFTYDQLPGHFDAVFKRNQALHDLRLSQIKDSLARITDLNVLKEHLLICERGNWADEVTTMIVERQIEIMHPAPQRRQGSYSLNTTLFSRPFPATIALKRGVPAHLMCGAGLVATARTGSYPTVLFAGTTTGLCSTTPQSLTAPAPGLFSQARRDGRSLFLFSQLLPLIPSLMERIWEHYHKENCSLVKHLINSGTTPGEISALQSLFTSEDYSPSARFWLSQRKQAPTKPCNHCSESGTECTPTRMGGSCVECILQLSPTCEHASLSWFFATHCKELSAFSALAANKPDFAKVVKWDKWNQLMPYAQEIVSKQVYEEFASYVQAYHHVLSKLSVNILQDIRIIVVANTTSLSLLRTAIDGAIIAAKARESKAREARIISSRLPLGVTIPTQDVVDRFRANLGAAGHRVLENASVHSTVGAIIDPGARVIVGLDNIAKMLKNSEAPHSLWIGSAANLAAIGVPVDAPGPSDQSIAATHNFLMKPSEAVGKALSLSSSTDSLPDLIPVSSPGSPTSTTYEMLYQDLTSDSNNLSHRY
ncbi:hypothetical protein B0H14DRAFT_2579932 [Mycena olivaceomarginata]|nr:hypothetical protein B0H14DRAFT_2579932 [Mycena olivaceomarginata]